MPTLVPQPFEALLRRMAYELPTGACFDLPSRSYHRAPEGLDLSVLFHGERAATCVGPAAGPQSQLAQNLVLAYLAGARVMELKTVQVKDDLVIPRPCIDVATVGFNVECSQELKVSESLEEYVKAWVLLHALRRADLGLGLSGAAGDFLFDVSVGYELAGIRSAKVRRFLDGLFDAGSAVDRLFAQWPRDLTAYRPERERVSNRVSSAITLSTFHGCPADDIERICEHLLVDVGAHVVLKLNPTLLGFEAVSALLRDKLGYCDIVPHKASFDADLKWTDALGLVRRLAALARTRGLSFGAKFSNTLVVENHKDFFPASEKLMYLSGQPLHVITLELCRRFREAFGEPLPISFSAGVDAKNFADCVAAGFVPVTTCTDLLRPGGYGRLPRYLEQLTQRMRKAGVDNISDFMLAESGRPERIAQIPGASLGELLSRAGLENHVRAAARVLEDGRYRASANTATPKKLGTRLWLFDCVSCDKCVPVCPNNANFSIEVPPELSAAVELPNLVVRQGRVVEEGKRRFALDDTHQLACYAHFCNECGNCDVFCPESGGPYAVKPRFFSSRLALEKAEERLDGFAVERRADGDWIFHRRSGCFSSLRLDGARSRARYEDAFASVELAMASFGSPLSLSLAAGAPEGHAIRLDLARAMAALLLGTLARGASSPVSAP